MSKKASSVAKGIAILMLLAHHLFYSQGRIEANGHGQAVSFAPFSDTAVIAVSQSLKVCVAVFVFISAYGMYTQLKGRFAQADPTDGQASEKASALYVGERLVKLYVNFWVVFIPFTLLGFAVSDHTYATVYGGHGIVRAIGYCAIDFMGLAEMFGTPTFNETWWYLSLALALIVLMPLLTVLADRISGWVLFGLSIVVPLMADFDTAITLWNYLPSATLGIAFAQHHLFERLDFGISKPAGKLALLVPYVVVLCALLYLRQSFGYIFIVNALSACVVCQIARCLEGPSVVLDFVGKHSMNIFFMHTFIYSYYFGQFVFSFHWFGLIFLVLLAASLACSVAIELLKKLLRIDQLRDRLLAGLRGLPMFAQAS